MRCPELLCSDHMGVQLPFEVFPPHGRLFIKSGFETSKAKWGIFAGGRINPSIYVAYYIYVAIIAKGYSNVSIANLCCLFSLSVKHIINGETTSYFLRKSVKNPKRTGLIRVRQRSTLSITTTMELTPTTTTATATKSNNNSSRGDVDGITIRR